MATVKEILSVKGDKVHTVGESISALEATQLMNAHGIGSLVVTRGYRVVGMFTERDVLRRIVAEQRDPEKVAVKDVMTVKVVCCRLDTPLSDVRSMVKDRRIRHVPVLDDNDALCGLISMGDLNAWNLRDGQATIQYMADYIYGRA
jgi:CBS domain-containing protein